MGERRLLGSFVGADFGGRLRAARQANGVTVRDIAHRTKIPLGILEALERNDASRLPGGLYSRSFVRAYAEEAGLDADDTLREFYRAFPAHAPPSARAPQDAGAGATTEAPPRAGRFPLVALLSLVLLGGLVVALGWRSSGGGDDGSNAGVARLPVGMSGTLPADPQGPGPDAAPVDRAMAAPTARDPERREAVAARAGPRQDTGAPIRMTIHPQRACWVRLTIDGRSNWARLMREGERADHEAAESIVVEVGDAGAFDYTLNGAPGRSFGASGQVVRRRIDRANLAEFQR